MTAIKARLMRLEKLQEPAERESEREICAQVFAPFLASLTDAELVLLLAYAESDDHDPETLTPAILAKWQAIAPVGRHWDNSANLQNNTEISQTDAATMMNVSPTHEAGVEGGTDCPTPRPRARRLDRRSGR